MKKITQTITLSVLLSGVLPNTAHAHFQMIQTDDTYLRDKGGKIVLNMPFTHPSHGSPMMNMPGKPLAFTVTHKDKTSDLSDSLTALDWAGTSNKAKAWQAETKLRKMGDYVFSLIPQPYLENSENKYIQQYTKVIYNVGGLPTNWDQPVGVDYEIIPRIAPYAIYAGGLFTGVVMAHGKPVADAEIEVEYLNHALHKTNDGFEKAAHIKYPSNHLNIQTIRADANGVFHFVPPVPGFWGFAALDLDDDQQYEGKALSQDAVLWIQAHELKRVK